jgi:hypothetical protein
MIVTPAIGAKSEVGINAPFLGSPTLGIGFGSAGTFFVAGSLVGGVGLEVVVPGVVVAGVVVVGVATAPPLTGETVAGTCVPAGG